MDEEEIKSHLSGRTLRGTGIVDWGEFSDSSSLASLKQYRQILPRLDLPTVLIISANRSST